MKFILVLLMLCSVAFVSTGGENASKKLTARELSALRKQAIEQNNVEAQYKLGLHYFRGKNKNDNHQAFKYFSMAAKENYAPAQCYLGTCLSYGEGVEQDREKAVKWYQKAAEQNYAPAQVSLAYCYAHGEGVKQDREKACKWYLKAAEQNYAFAQLQLGIAYVLGWG